jgi:hypothetical protein
MTAEIVAINSDVTRQKELLESFRAAACLLDHEVIEEILTADEWHRYDLLADLATEMAEKVICPSSDLLSRFKGAAIETLVTMMPNFGCIDHDNHKAVQETIEYARYDLMTRYKHIAIEANLLPRMFASGHQHAHLGISLTL